MKKIVLILLAVIFLFAGLASAEVVKYKYQFVLTADTDGQTPTSAWKWHRGRQAWGTAAKGRVVSTGCKPKITYQYDSATTAGSATTNFDINFLSSIDGTVFDNDPYWSEDDIGDGKIKTNGLNAPSSYMKITIDEDSSNTGTIDIQIEVTTSPGDC